MANELQLLSALTERVCIVSNISTHCSHNGQTAAEEAGASDKGEQRQMMAQIEEGPFLESVC